MEMVPLVKSIMDLHAYLDEYPGDLPTRSVLSDLMEEIGENDEATFQRWLVSHKKWPDSKYPCDEGQWHWWSSSEEERRYGEIPQFLQRLMPQCEWQYPTRREAEAGLMCAWLKLPAELRT